MVGSVGGCCWLRPVARIMTERPCARTKGTQMNLLTFLFLLYTAKEVFVDDNPHLQSEEEDYDDEDYDEYD